MSIQSDNTSQYAHIVLVAKMLIAQTDNVETKTLTTSPEGKGNTWVAQTDSFETKTLTGSPEGKRNTRVAQTGSIEKTLTSSPEGKRNTLITQTDSIETKTLTSSAEGKRNAVIAQMANAETKTLTSSPEGKGNSRKVDFPLNDFTFTLPFSASNTSNPDPQASGKGKWSSFWEVLSALCLAPMKDDNVM